MQLPTFDEFKKIRIFDANGLSIFINMNRLGKTFIRANVYPNMTKTFPYSHKGYSMAVKFVQEGLAHVQ